MTKDEAKEFLEKFLEDRPNFREEHPGQDEEVYRQMDRLTEALDMAIEALGKDTDVPSNGPDIDVGDLISRAAAIDVVKGIDRYFVKYIEELPAAQPEPKRGRWIDGSVLTYSACSVCGYQERYANGYNYCPNCGAKMEEGTA